MTTKIEWCDITWNPVWGCKNNCEYCYARKIAKRFGSKIALKEWNFLNKDNGYGKWDGKFCENLNNFIPTWIESNFQKSFPKKPSKIFVNSMSDIAFWIDNWMKMVIEKIKCYPQHIFMFLTKFPKIYFNYDSLLTENCMIGFTATKQNMFDLGNNYFADLGNPYKKFISIEPIIEKIKIKHFYGQWLIIGAETGNRKNKIEPKPEWIGEITGMDIPVFMKNNLRPFWKGKFRQEFPEIKERIL